jgi:hypothetical protein
VDLTQLHTRNTGVQFPAVAMMGFFLFATASRPVLGPTHSPIQWVPGALSPGVKRPGHEADHSPNLVPKLRMRGAIHPLPKYICMAW